MDRQLLNYLPGVLRELPEFKALMAAEQPEIEALWQEQDNVLENQFVLSATAAGIKRWEQILKITPKGTDELNARRARVMSLLLLKLPYTLSGLREWLNGLCGAGNYTLGTGSYNLDIELDYDKIPAADSLIWDILSSLRAICPANIHLELGGGRASRGAVRAYGCAQSTAVLDVWPQRQELSVGGSVRLVGYTEYLSVLGTQPIARGGMSYS